MKRGIERRCIVIVAGAAVKAERKCALCRNAGHVRSTCPTYCRECSKFGTLADGTRGMVPVLRHAKSQCPAKSARESGALLSFSDAESIAAGKVPPQFTPWTLFPPKWRNDEQAWLRGLTGRTVRS